VRCTCVCIYDATVQLRKSGVLFAD
jgi:hypothetical protein